MLAVTFSVSVVVRNETLVSMCGGLISVTDTVTVAGAIVVVSVRTCGVQLGVFVR